MRGVLADRAYLAVQLMVRVVVCLCLSVICRGCIVSKRCQIGLSFLLITNRKSHIGFQMT